MNKILEIFKEHGVQFYAGNDDDDYIKDLEAIYHKSKAKIELVEDILSAFSLKLDEIGSYDFFNEPLIVLEAYIQGDFESCISSFDYGHTVPTEAGSYQQKIAGFMGEVLEQFDEKYFELNQSNPELISVQRKYVNSLLDLLGDAYLEAYKVCPKC